MTNDTITLKTRSDERISFGARNPVSAILVAFAPTGMVTVDRCIVKELFTVGRNPDCDLPVRDSKVSKNHFRITQTEEDIWIEDLGSTNSTFVQGIRISARQKLAAPAIIRLGQVVLVFHTDAASMLEPPPAEQYALAGRFHTGPLIKQLREASISFRHILLAGPTGSGKELAAQALAAIEKKQTGKFPYVAHNAAQFASEEEAAATLFGVGPKVFTGVDARAGLIEQASGGMLFLDEVHNLPIRVQRGLLRVIENGFTKRIGEARTRSFRVRFILASNVDAPDCGLAPDLFARLRLVTVPPLRDRAADVPCIFNSVLSRSLRTYHIDESAVMPLLTADHYEALVLDGFTPDNVRGLVDLADRLATRIASGAKPENAVTSVFFERFSESLVARRQSKPPVRIEDTTASHYELNKAAIVAAYHECNGNMSAVERLLHSRGISCSRRWLKTYAVRWGLRRE